MMPQALATGRLAPGTRRACRSAAHRRGGRQRAGGAGRGPQFCATALTLDEGRKAVVSGTGVWVRQLERERSGANRVVSMDLNEKTKPAGLYAAAFLLSSGFRLVIVVVLVIRVL